MTTDKFWELIEYSRSEFDSQLLNGNQERQTTLLMEALILLPAREVEDYSRIFSEYRFLPYTYDHWMAALVLEGGVSDDAFDDFRAWMISMGKTPYHEMLDTVDNLADYAKAPGVECIFFEDFLYIPSGAYQKITGNDLPYRKSIRPPKPAGKKRTIEDFQVTFPKIWAKRCRISWPDSQ